ncbi:BURP domain-containing protein 12 [Carex littledalei]|uniref:BURP domain-containing protein 12 n=1 Tax=Carex littledalei TaxID=544730 RepID=A0A833RLI9_9POAL|nr:BURP domain-containing protein 12 [Carex littledalei]
MAPPLPSLPLLLLPSFPSTRRRPPPSTPSPLAPPLSVTGTVNRNFTNYATSSDKGTSSFSNYSPEENIPVNSFRRYGRDGTGHNSSFVAYSADANVDTTNFTSYGGSATGGSTGFTAYDHDTNAPDLKFSSYGDQANGLDQRFTTYSTDANAGDQSFRSYGKNGNGVPTEFTSYGNDTNVIGSGFSNYGEGGNGATDGFNNYGKNGNVPENNFRNYGSDSNAAIDTFKSYREEANVGDDTFTSYDKDANAGSAEFQSYGKSFNPGSVTFKSYGQGKNPNHQIKFTTYFVDNVTFKEYSKSGVTFQDYNKSILALNLTDVKSTSKWVVEPGKFFRESELKEGNVMPMPDIKDKMPVRSFLPRSIVGRIPFEAEAVKSLFGLEQDSALAKGVDETVGDCKRAPNRDETKRCATSAEDMIDFAVEMLGDDIVVRSTESANGSGGPIMIGKVKGINGGKVTRSVSCHQSLFPYMVYYCHSVPKVRVYEADILAVETEKKINRGVAICHLDTSAWSPSHGAFVALGGKPGQIEVCHWIFNGDMTWAVADRS